MDSSREMGHYPFWVVLISFLLFLVANAETEDVKLALISFMEKLSPQRTPDWGWNATSDPCKDGWVGVTCDATQQSVMRIVLDDLSLTGSLDAGSLCMARSLLVLSLSNNSLTGTLPEIILECYQLSHLYVNGNRFSGPLPLSLAWMNNLKRIDVSNNDFSDDLPHMSRVSGLLSFLAQNNRLSGTIPMFNFSNLVQFNVSNNNLTGSIPDNGGGFGASSFSGNPGLCGKPLPTACPPTAPPATSLADKHA